MFHALLVNAHKQNVCQAPLISDYSVHSRCALEQYRSKSLSSTAQDLFTALQKILGVRAMNKGECSALVSLGTDGAAVNVVRAGLKGLVEKEHPRVLRSW